MKKRLKVLLCLLIAGVLTLSGLIVPASAEDNVPNTIKMPITIYDHLNDGLLFEYALADVLNASGTEGENLPYPNLGLNSDDTKASTGLVEQLLDKDTKKPVYTQETVEIAAKLVQLYLQKNPTVTIDGTDDENEVFNKIKEKLLKEEKTETIPLYDKSIDNFNLTNKGWDFGDDLTYDAGNKAWKNNDGDIIWQIEGQDELTCKGNIGSKAEYTYNGLKSGSYKLNYWETTTTIGGFDASIQINNDSPISIEKNNTIFEVKNDNATVKITLTRNATEVTNQSGYAKFVAPVIYLSNSDTVVISNFTVISGEEKNNLLKDLFSQFNLQKDNDSTWRISLWGGITCVPTDDSNAYNIDPKGEAWIDKTVNGSTVYTLTFDNENDLCDVRVTDQNNNELEGCKKTKKSVQFKSPEDGKIRIIFSQDESQKSVSGFRKISNMQLTSDKIIPLGNYNDSKEKYTKGNSKGLDDIETCMDYTYYVLNNLWSSTNNDDITKKSNAYKTITLQKESNTDNYTINQENLVYDVKNQNIYQDNENVKNSGFFPLDRSVFENTGVAYDGYSDEYELSGADENATKHNYHFAMRAHTQFVYKEKDNLHFTFNGDDDVYLFINGYLVLDLGGAHYSVGDTVDINKEIEDGALKDAGIQDGDICSMEFFYLERHSIASNFQLTTNIKFLHPKSTSSVEFTKVTQNGEEKIDNNTELELYDKIGIQYSVIAGNDEMTNVQFEDTELGMLINKDEIQLGNGIVVGENGLTLTIKDEDGNVIKTKTISKDDIENKDKWKEFLNGTDNDIVSINENQTISISGLYRTVDEELLESLLKSQKLFTSNLITKLDVTLPVYDDETGNYEETEQQAISEDTIQLIPKNEPKAKLDVNLVAKDKDGNELTSDTVPEESRVYINYQLTANSNWMKGVSIDDKRTGIRINKEEIVIPEGYDIDDKITITGPDGSIEITKDDLENANVLQEKLKVLDIDDENAWELDNTEKITISGIYTILTRDKDKVESNISATFYGPKPTYNEETNEFNVSYVSAENLEDRATIIKNTTYDVIFVVKENGSFDEGAITEYRVAKGEVTGEQPAVNPNDHYEFTGWVDENGELVKNPEKVAIDKARKFTAKFAPKTYNYTVKYVDGEGNNLVKSVTKTEKFGSTVKENAMDITGYSVDEAEKSIEMKVDGNEITFVYTPNSYDYTVKYVDEDGNKLANPVTKEGTFGNTVTEKAIDISGYSVDEAEKSIEMKVDGNEITFVYTPNSYDYTVKYEDKEGNELADPVTKEGTFGSTVTEKAVDITGYSVDKAEKSIEMKVEGNEMTFVYKKIVKTSIPQEDTKQKSTSQQDSQKSSSNLKTGDNTNMIIYVLTAILSLAIIVVVFITKLRKKNR